MSLRTAPCPTCAGTIVFGERRCRSCGMTFDYGAEPPPEPTQADIFDALLSAPEPAAQPTPAPRPSAATPQPRPTAPITPPPRPATQAPGGATLEGLDTGRFSVGEVAIEDIPGFIDSTLFRGMTPDNVDAAPIPGLEVTRVALGDVPEIKHLDVDAGRADVGEVPQMAAIPGLEGASMFRVNIDFAAGGEHSDMLQVSHLIVHPKSDAKSAHTDELNLSRIVCSNCGLAHAKPRCPTCGTPHPDAHPDD